MNKVVKQDMKKLGKKGGTTTKKKYGLSHFSKIGKLGVEAKKQK